MSGGVNSRPLVERPRGKDGGGCREERKPMNLRSIYCDDILTSIQLGVWRYHLLWRSHCVERTVCLRGQWTVQQLCAIIYTTRCLRRRTFDRAIDTTWDDRRTIYHFVADWSKRRHVIFTPLSNAEPCRRSTVQYFVDGSTVKNIDPSRDCNIEPWR